MPDAPGLQVSVKLSFILVECVRVVIFLLFITAYMLHMMLCYSCSCFVKTLGPKFGIQNSYSGGDEEFKIHNFEVRPTRMPFNAKNGREKAWKHLNGLIKVKRNIINSSGNKTINSISQNLTPFFSEKANLCL